MNDVDLEHLGSMQQMVGEMSQGDSSTLMLSIIFGVVGMFYFSYGKKQEEKTLFLYSGLGLMLFPYLVEGRGTTLLVGTLLTLLPFFLRV